MAERIERKGKGMPGLEMPSVRGRIKAETANEVMSAPVITPAAPIEAETLDRISIALNKDGSIAWDRMRPTTQDTVRKLIGVPAPGAAAFDPLIVGVLYDALGVLAVNIARATGHTVESSKQMLFTDQEKATLIAPTQKVLDKYGAQLARWNDEIALTMLLGVTVQGKIARLEREATAIRRFSKDSAPVTG